MKLRSLPKDVKKSVSLRIFAARRKAELWFWRLNSKPTLDNIETKNKDGKTLLHLGSGDVLSSDFINIDAKPGPYVDVVADVRDLRMFSDGSVDLVYACHVLEHFPRDEQRQVILEWKRVLKKGGTLRLSVPDFDKLLTIYKVCEHDVVSIATPLMGYEDGYRGHCYLFNEKYLRNLLEDLEFKEIHIWDPQEVKYHDFEDWASRPLLRKDKEYPISLNIEGIV